MGVPTPTFIPEPFANAAGGTNRNFPIPDAPPGSPANAASWSQGFPSITMQPEISGGLPPLGQDFNGVLYTLTQHTYAQQAGQPYGFNASFVVSIAGYAAGAMLGMGDGTGTWLNTTAGNTTNPDVDASAAGWVPGISYGIATLTGLTGGTVSVKPSKSRRCIIELFGTLTSNLIVNLPNTIQEWLIVNNTTGAFSTTVQTAGGTGVTVPQGGPTGPTGVWGDGTNIYPTVAPLSVSIAQAATPLTLLQRDNTGQGFLTRLNQSSALETPTIGSVFVQNTAADGYLRKISLANFLSQIFSVVNGSSGSITLGPIIIKWGPFTLPSGGSVTTNFNAPFPTGCYAVVPTQGQSASYGYPFAVTSVTASNFTVGPAIGGINAGSGFYIAIGH